MTAGSAPPTWPAVAAAAVGGIALGTLSRNLPVSLGRTRSIRLCHEVGSPTMYIGGGFVVLVLIIIVVVLLLRR